MTANEPNMKPIVNPTNPPVKAPIFTVIAGVEGGRELVRDEQVREGSAYSCP